MGVMYAMDETGHRDVVEWSDSPESQRVARNAFDEFKRQGCAMFVLDEDEEDAKGRKLDEFDPNVGAFIAVRPRQGG